MLCLAWQHDVEQSPADPRISSESRAAGGSYQLLDPATRYGHLGGEESNVAICELSQYVNGIDRQAIRPEQGWKENYAVDFVCGNLWRISAGPAGGTKVR
jgi:hypothetical protein